jgi:hypothetical protein
VDVQLDHHRRRLVAHVAVEGRRVALIGDRDGDGRGVRRPGRRGDGGRQRDERQEAEQQHDREAGLAGHEILHPGFE